MASNTILEWALYFLWRTLSGPFLATNQIDVAFHLDRERVALHDAVLTSCDVIEQQRSFRSVDRGATCESAFFIYTRRFVYG